MGTSFVQIPLQLIGEDDRNPDLDNDFIYEHLKYFLSRPSMFPLPAIVADYANQRIVVTRGHKYLRIARELGRSWIRTVLPTEAIGRVRRLSEDIRIVPQEEIEHELAMQVVQESHVYFFERPLSGDAQKKFAESIAGFFERLQTPLIGPSVRRVPGCAFPFEARCAEFEALIPVGDPSWNSAYRAVCIEFSQSVARIVSFQGRRFHM